MNDTETRYIDRDEKYSRIIHGEVNAILNAKEPLNGYTLYTVPFMPCSTCASIVIQSGIKRVVSITPSDYVLERWKDDLSKSLSYLEECDVDYVEYVRD